MLLIDTAKDVQSNERVLGCRFNLVEYVAPRPVTARRCSGYRDGFQAPGLDAMDLVGSLARAGDAVRIRNGPSAGLTGILDSVSPSTAFVEIPASTPGSHSAAVIETELSNITRLFKVGDKVDVKFGELKGRQGIIYSIEGDELRVINTADLQEVSS